MTAAAVRGHRSARAISATLKHFPGHGDTVTDSHTGVPWIFHTREQWEQTDAPPFRAGIAAGVDMVMTAHVVMPELQSDCDVDTQEGCDPATLDQEILTGLLREELGYRGVVVTDALNMAGVREKYGDDRDPGARAEGGRRHADDDRHADRHGQPRRGLRRRARRRAQRRAERAADQRVRPAGARAEGRGAACRGRPVRERTQGGAARSARRATCARRSASPTTA